MKKSVLILSLLVFTLILSTIIIQAEENLVVEPAKPDTISPATTNTTSPITDTDNSDEPVISATFQKLFKLIFKLKEVKFSEVVIMSALLILAILIIQQALSFGMEDKAAAWLIAIIIPLIASSAGGMQHIANIWRKVGETLQISSKASVFWTSVGIILLVIIYIILIYFKKTTEEADIIVNAKAIGTIEGMREVKERIKRKLSG